MSKSPLVYLILLVQILEVLAGRLDVVQPLVQMVLHPLMALLPGMFRIELLHLILLVMN